MAINNLLPSVILRLALKYRMSVVSDLGSPRFSFSTQSNPLPDVQGVKLWGKIRPASFVVVNNNIVITTISVSIYLHILRKQFFIEKYKQLAIKLQIGLPDTFLSTYYKVVECMFVSMLAGQLTQSNSTGKRLNYLVIYISAI